MDIIKRIQDFDKELSLTYPIKERVNLYIVGGSALYLHGLLKRPTLDIDAFLKPTYKQDLLDIMARYDINTRAQQVYADNFPHDFISRAIKVDIETQSLNVYKVSIEDIVISKLVAARPKDLRDIEQTDIISLLNWDLLEALYHEKIGDFLNARIEQDFTYEYKKYVEINKK